MYYKTYKKQLTKRRLRIWKFKTATASILWVGLLVIITLYSSGIIRPKMTDERLESYNRVVPQGLVERIRLDFNSSQDIKEIRKACYNNGLGELCVSDLWAIGKVESNNNNDIQANINTNSTTDLGYFRINSVHNLAVSCVTDVYCSADWVIKRLIKNGYLEDRLYALGTHNSKTPIIHARYLAKLTNYLTIKQ